jgi:hypothetical protein
MPARHIALVPEFGMNPSDLARVSAALQKQVTRDLEPIWQVAATVDAFPSLEDVPAGYWPIILTFRAVGSDAGIHVDRNGQPFAILEITPSWSLTASHVCLEMVTDPFGSRTFPGPSPRPDQGDVEFLGAICDPCEHAEFAYVINDVLVSDFCTPAFWDPAESSRDRRSFTGAIQAPYQVLPGGHLSWYDPTTNRWWLRRVSNGVLSDVEVGAADPEQGSVREFMGRHSPHLAGTKMTFDAFEARVGMRRQRALRASQSRAYWLRAAFGVRGPDALEHDGEVRAALNGSRRARVLSNNPAQPAAAVPMPDASEPTMTVDESALEPGEPVMEREIAQALERVQGEIRSTPPPPVVGARTERVTKPRATPIPPPAASPAREMPEVEAVPSSAPPPARRTLPPPLPPNAALPAPLPPPKAREALPAPPPVPTANAPAVAPFAAYSNLPPGTTIPPAAVSVVPPSRPSGGPSSVRRPDSRVMISWMIAAAALAFAGLVVFKGQIDQGRAGAAAESRPAVAEPEVRAPTVAPSPVPVVAAAPPVAVTPPPPAVVAASDATKAPAAAVAAPVPSTPPQVAPQPSAAPAPVAVAAPAPPRPVVWRPVAPQPKIAPAPPAESPAAQRPATAAPIDSLIDDRR